MASILLPFPPSQRKLVRASQLERNVSPCLPRSRSKRVLPGGLVLPRHGSTRRGSAAGKTPQGWKKQKDETGSIQGGDVEDEDSGSAIAGNPGEIALMHQTLEKIKSSLPAALSTSNWFRFRFAGKGHPRGGGRQHGQRLLRHVLTTPAETTAVKPFRRGGFLPHPRQASL